MPPKGVNFRGRQIATLSEVAHEMFTSAALGDILKELSGRAELSPQQKKNVELSLEDFTKVKKFSSAFVREMSETVSTSYHTWIKARRQNDFSVFQSSLTKLVELKRMEADIIGYEEHPYNALLNEYERGATVKELDRIFVDVQGPLNNYFTKLSSNPHLMIHFFTSIFHEGSSGSGANNWPAT